ncbi:uncharacterized protein LOC117652587 [Thrips palmi]|uniref:Uncharacterized protein LOC117652587 n=1 Tax=Thrips palmi TaxID=161013 RepID=A0A6P9A6B3_THRPL|nr:uncharacterized protein LOC117652587 [Thrips palmi]
MAIPFQLPRCDENPDDIQDLDRLLGDLFVVLARILAQRGQAASVATLNAGRGAVTIRRPSRQLRLQVHDTEVDLEVSSEESSSSDTDSSAPPSPTSPTAPMPIPDLVSNLPVQAAAADAPQEQAENAEGQPPRTVASVAVRSRTRKPRSSPRKARSPKGARGKRALTGTSPAKELTRTPSTRAPKASPTVC